jgi:2-phospho-L-lactate/phosphoenolpyruvate guanylyltransferase
MKDAAVLIPVKRFQLAKRRLARLLDDSEREALARWLAERVVAAAAPLPVFVACDDEAVAVWADEAGAEVLWTPGLGLNGAVESSRATISGKGFDHLVIAHSDLPLASDLGRLAAPGTIVLVPDRRGGGTNVLALPVEAGIAASYGAGSFQAHLSQALEAGAALGVGVQVRRDPRLALDVDTPDDLAHPALRTELPGWLPAILANRR